MNAELILYACPQGDLAKQIEHYFAIARATLGWNPAHDYMPHCSLTGFFHDTVTAIPAYLHAIEKTLAVKRSSMPEPVIQIEDILLRSDFHGITLRSDWLLHFTEAFAAGAPSASRLDALRLKRDLHLSFAYRFPTQDHQPLATLARRTVMAHAPVWWNICFYQRREDKTWACHGQWPLKDFKESASCF